MKIRRKMTDFIFGFVLFCLERKWANVERDRRVCLSACMPLFYDLMHF